MKFARKPTFGSQETGYFGPESGETKSNYKRKLGYIPRGFGVLLCS
jgi:hypothetical protein